MNGAMNPFVGHDAATRYRRYRPDYSRHLASILSDVGAQAHRALDVAAGTGISTAAIASVAREVIAVDASPSMIAQARDIPNASWIVAGAERLPIRSSTVDLISIGSALHWVHRDAFVSEAVRVATADAGLIVHDHGFTGQMDEMADFTTWVHQRYLRGYPAPARGEKLAPGSDLGPFRFVATHRYEQPVEVSRDTLAGYLTTQSNLQVVMTSRRAATAVLGWLQKELSPFFIDRDVRTVRFAGMATILQRR